MQTSYHWLKELVTFGLDADGLADGLTAIGTAVQSVRPMAVLDSHTTVAEVVATEPHPEADRLTCCRLLTGAGEKMVVCGAPNVRAGLKVVHVAPGGRLPGGPVIAESEIRGVTSFGMICSEAELGLAGDEDVILELPDDYAVGLPAQEVFSDQILDFDLTPNRPDCLSVFGIARETGALVEAPFQRPKLDSQPAGPPIGDSVAVRIDDPEGCPRYAVALIEGLKIGPSPWWLRQRIQASGMRPINNIVDITNFVMMETGQPLHAFDYDRLGRKEIVVRKSAAGEEFTTLDDKTHKLPADVVLITDGAATMALGGVMGGLESEVCEQTQTVLLESAYFAPQRTRRARKALGIESEAALRFEKGTDPNMVPYALQRAAALMAALGGGAVRQDQVDVYPEPITPRVIPLRTARTNAILGLTLSADDITRYLELLGLKVETGEETSQVTVPTYRPDLEREIDLIEEVARLYGYERIPIREQGGGRLFDWPDHDSELEEVTHRALAGAGFSEAVTNSMGAATDYRIFQPDEGLVKITNPLSEELAYLRNGLLADLARTASHNFNHRNLDWKLYTLGTVFLPLAGEAPPREDLRLGLALAGLRAPRHWQGPSNAFGWYDLKGAMEDLCAELRLPVPEFVATPVAGLADSAAFQVRVGEQIVGTAGKLSPEGAARWDVKEPLWLAELSFQPLRDLRRGEPEYQPLPRHPAVTRDLALVVTEAVRSLAVLSTIRAVGGELLGDVEVFDLYRGKPLPEGSKSLAFSLTFRSPERSLQAEEVDHIMEQITAAVRDQHQATLRS